MSSNTPATRQQSPAPEKPALKDVKALLESDAFRAQIARVLPKHLTPDRMIRVAITSAMRTPKLLLCTSESLTGALLTLSQLGLEPDGRRAHLIPYENKKKGVYECQVIVDYKGLAELAMRSGLVSNIHADVVRENDAFEYDRGDIKTHKIDFRKDRGPAYAFYAICRFRDGSEKADVMSLDEIEAIRLRSKSPNDGPWSTDPVEMAKKTVFRRLSKWLPLSPEFRDAVEVDDDPSAAEPVNVTPRPIFSTIPAASESRDELPERSETSPEPIPQPAATKHEPVPVSQPAKSAAPAPAAAPTATMSAQDQLAAIVIGAGANFDQFKEWARGEGFLTPKDDPASFDEVATATASRLVRSKAGLVSALTLIAGGDR